MQTEDKNLCNDYTNIICGVLGIVKNKIYPFEMYREHKASFVTHLYTCLEKKQAEN